MEEDDHTFKGYITREHTIWCGGGCNTWERLAVEKKSLVEKICRRAGWTFSKKNGWRCPNCSKKESS